MPLTADLVSQAILDVCRDTGHVYPDNDPPLLARSTHHQKRRRYLFTKKLPLWRSQRHEFIYLFHVDRLDFNSMAQCLDIALEHGRGQIKPGREHRRWDLSVILLCDRAHPDALERLEAFRHAKAYTLGLRGRMQLRAVALDCSTGELTHSRRGRSLAGFVRELIPQTT